MNTRFPASVKAVLWSYDVDKLDLRAHKAHIITNVLNLGTHDAVAWLFATYSRHEIAAQVEHPRPGEWNLKSLNYWALVFGLEPKVTARFA